MRVDIKNNVTDETRFTATQLKVGKLYKDRDGDLVTVAMGLVDLQYIYFSKEGDVGILLKPARLEPYRLVPSGTSVSITQE